MVIIISLLYKIDVKSSPLHNFATRFDIICYLNTSSTITLLGATKQHFLDFSIHNIINYFLPEAIGAFKMKDSCDS